MSIVLCKCCLKQMNCSPRTFTTVCPNCKFEQSVPDAPDDKIAQFNRANIFRQNGRFDEANAVYSSLMGLNSAEISWGMALCTFGVIYKYNVDTKKTEINCTLNKKESMYDSALYAEAISKAQGRQRAIYLIVVRYIEESRLATCKAGTEKAQLAVESKPAAEEAPKAQEPVKTAPGFSAGLSSGSAYQSQVRSGTKQPDNKIASTVADTGSSEKKDNSGAGQKLKDEVDYWLAQYQLVIKNNNPYDKLLESYKRQENRLEGLKNKSAAFNANSKNYIRYTGEIEDLCLAINENRQKADSRYEEKNSLGFFDISGRKKLQREIDDLNTAIDGENEQLITVINSQNKIYESIKDYKSIESIEKVILEETKTLDTLKSQCESVKSLVSIKRSREEVIGALSQYRILSEIAKKPKDLLIIAENDYIFNAIEEHSDLSAKLPPEPWVFQKRYSAPKIREQAGAQSTSQSTAAYNSPKSGYYDNSGPSYSYADIMNRERELKKKEEELKKKAEQLNNAQRQTVNPNGEYHYSYKNGSKTGSAEIFGSQYSNSQSVYKFVFVHPSTSSAGSIKIRLGWNGKWIKISRGSNQTFSYATLSEAMQASTVDFAISGKKYRRDIHFTADMYVATVTAYNTGRTNQIKIAMSKQ